MPENAH